MVANGFAAAVTILALLLAGAAAANLDSPVLLTAAAVVLIAGCVGRVRLGQVGGGVGGQGDDEGFDGRRGEGVHRGDLAAQRSVSSVVTASAIRWNQTVTAAQALAGSIPAAASA